jgi:hypothetical protein
MRMAPLVGMEWIDRRFGGSFGYGSKDRKNDKVVGTI